MLLLADHRAVAHTQGGCGILCVLLEFCVCHGCRVGAPVCSGEWFSVVYNIGLRPYISLLSGTPRRGGLENPQPLKALVLKGKEQNGWASSDNAGCIELQQAGRIEML